MKSLNVGIFNDAEIGKVLGKKGTESDIVFYNRKETDCVYTFMQPLDDKVSPKSQLMSIIDAAIVSFEQMNPGLGETILMLDAMGISRGVVLVHPGTDVKQVVEMTKGTSLETFILREKVETHIMETLSKIEPKRDSCGETIVQVDHSFSVKGVGEVVLGFVRQGTVKKYQKLSLLPAGKEVLVRSIQMHDKDYDEAGPGSRVGLCIKGADAAEMKRGTVLSAPEACSVSAKEKFRFRPNPFYPCGPRDGSFHVAVGMQTFPARLFFEGSEATVESDKPFVYSGIDTFLMLDLNAPKLHLIGTGKESI